MSIGKRREECVVQGRRYGSASEVVREGLHLVEERVAKLTALRQTIEASIAEGEARSQDEVSAALSAKAQALANEGLQSERATGAGSGGGRAKVRDWGRRSL